MTTQTTLMTETGGGGAARILGALRRRRTLVMLPFAFVLAAAAALAYVLPNVWMARAVILVDPQQIPDAFVKQTISADPVNRDRQVQALSQQILSRPRLTEVVTTFKLNGPDEAPADAAEGLRRIVKIEPVVDDATTKAGTYANYGGLVAFSVSFQSTDPELAAAITNRIAKLYVEENERQRERQSTTTSEFLDTQLVELSARLQSQEKRIAEYKERHMGELPEQRDANLRTLERLQQQLQIGQENLRRANERKNALDRTLAEIQTQSAPTITVNPDLSPGALAAGRIKLLRQELAAAEAQYGTHDDRSARVREQLQRYEAQAASAPRPTTSAPGDRTPSRRAATPPDNPYVISLLTQLDAANVETKTTAQDIAAINGQIAVYQRRIEGTPRTERELAQLTQEHDSLREMQKSLMARRGEAKMAANYEQARKGETFRIIESASAPAHPSGPNRLRVLLLGLVVGLGASALAVVIAEQLDSSYRSPDELRTTLAVPVVGAIPSIRTERDRQRALRRRAWVTAAVGASLFVVVGMASIVGHHNTALAGLLTPAMTPNTR